MPRAPGGGLRRVDPVNFAEVAWRAIRLTPEAVAVVQDEELPPLRRPRPPDPPRVDARPRGGRSAGRACVLCSPNDQRFPEALLGTLHAGAVATPLNTRFAPETLRYVAAHSEGRVLITHTSLAGGGGGPRRRAGVRGRRPWLAGRHRSGTGGRRGRSRRPRRAHVHVGFDRPPARRVLSPIASKWWQARSTAALLHARRGRPCLITGPLYHVNALWGSLLPASRSERRRAMIESWTAARHGRGRARYRPTYTAGRRRCSRSCSPPGTRRLTAT